MLVRRAFATTIVAIWASWVVAACLARPPTWVFLAWVFSALACPLLALADYFLGRHR